MIVIVLSITTDGFEIMTKIKTTAKLLNVAVFIHHRNIYMHMKNDRTGVWSTLWIQLAGSTGATWLPDALSQGAWRLVITS